MSGDEPPHEPTVDDLKRALQVIRVMAIREARLRGWCSEYESFAEEVNRLVGFPALSGRIRRQTVRFMFDVRFRGTADAINEAHNRLNEYIYNFEAPELLSVEVSNFSDTWGVGEEEDERGLTEPEADRASVDALDLGLAVAGCNCASCQDERLRAAAQRERDRNMTGPNQAAARPRPRLRTD
jgi:hypothetical protein